jgi:hypothetical protein
MTTSTTPTANGAPLSKTESYSASKSAMAAIFGSDHKYAQSSTSEQQPDKKESGVEPPAGVQGKGTATQPYDQGNAAEGVAPDDKIADSEKGGSGEKEGIEPVNGVQGKGTPDQPYDQGNSAGKFLSSQSRPPSPPPHPHPPSSGIR